MSKLALFLITTNQKANASFSEKEIRQIGRYILNRLFVCVVLRINQVTVISDAGTTPQLFTKIAGHLQISVSDMM